MLFTTVKMDNDLEKGSQLYKLGRVSIGPRQIKKDKVESGLMEVLLSREKTEKTGDVREGIF